MTSYGKRDEVEPMQHLLHLMLNQVMRPQDHDCRSVVLWSRVYACCNTSSYAWWVVYHICMRARIGFEWASCSTVN